jgi:Mobilization protein NikA
MHKRTGRPELPVSQQRRFIFRFLVTKSEALRIRDQARSLGLTISEYLRSVAIPKNSKGGN